MTQLINRVLVTVVLWDARSLAELSAFTAAFLPRLRRDAVIEHSSPPEQVFPARPPRALRHLHPAL